MRTTLAACVLLGLAGFAQAHFIWLTPESDKSSALMIFSDSLEPDGNVPITKIAQTKVLARVGTTGEQNGSAYFIPAGEKMGQLLYSGWMQPKSTLTPFLPPFSSPLFFPPFLPPFSSPVIHCCGILSLTLFIAQMSMSSSVGLKRSSIKPIILPSTTSTPSQ